MKNLVASQAKYQWIALGLVIAGMIVGYSIPVLQSPSALAATRSCSANCKGDDCPHKKNKDCNAEDCGAGLCDCQK